MPSPSATPADQKQRLLPNGAGDSAASAGYESIAGALSYSPAKPLGTRSRLEQKLALEQRIKYFDRLGETFTALAMLPQGVLGGLLAYTYARTKDIDIAWSIFLLVLFGLASFEGKRRLVRFFNTQDFKDLAKVKCDDLDRFFRRELPSMSKTRLALTVINGYLIHVAAKTFAGLAFLALEQIGNQVIRGYFKDYPGAEISADIITHPAFGFIFAISSYLANLLAFRAIHFYGSSLVLSGAEFLLENSEYRAHRISIEQEIARFRVLLRTHAENGEWDLYKGAISELKNLRSTPLLDITTDAKSLSLSKIDDVQALRMSIISFVYSNEQSLLIDQMKNTRNTIGWRIFSRVTAATCSTVSIIGLYNFIDMTTASNNYMRFPAFLNPAEGYFDYFFSMSLLAFNSVWPFIINLFEGDRGIRFASNAVHVWNLFITTVACALGGMPNGEQSYLDGENIYMIAFFSLLSSAIIEAGGFIALTTNNDNDKICVNDPQKNVALANDRLLKNNEDLTQIAASDLYQLIAAKKHKSKLSTSATSAAANGATADEKINGNGNANASATSSAAASSAVTVTVSSSSTDDKSVTEPPKWKWRPFWKAPEAPSLIPGPITTEPRRNSSKLRVMNANRSASASAAATGAASGLAKAARNSAAPAP